MVLWARTVPIMKNVLGMHVHVILHILSSRLLGNSRKKVSSIYVSKVTLLASFSFIHIQSMTNATHSVSKDFGPA